MEKNKEYSKECKDCQKVCDNYNEKGDRERCHIFEAYQNGIDKGRKEMQELYECRYKFGIAVQNLTSDFVQSKIDHTASQLAEDAFYK